MHVNYEDLPGFNNLFIDYINSFSLVSPYYKYDYHDDDSFLSAINAKKESYLKHSDYSRQDVSAILKSQNEFFNSSDKTFENIQMLNDDNTFAVVTGQQVGILSGNYYTILKAINTIQLSDYLNTIYPDYKFIPVFWLECDDHDFEEINHINIFDSKNILTKLEYFKNGTPQEKYLTPADRNYFDNHIENFKEELFRKLSNTDFAEEIKNIINRSYKEGLNFTVTFARYMNFILKDKGLVFINPADAEIKNILKPVFEKELQSFPQSCENVIENSAMLEQNYQPQIKPQVINLFYIYNNNRYLIENKTENVFSLKNSRQTFSKEEMFFNLEKNTKDFSPNVVLRPICQDYLLPTITYIGGPSEIAYFAQLKKVYETFDVEMPVIYPRTSVTFLENRVNNFLVKNEIKFEDIFDTQKVKMQIIEKTSEVNVEDIISEYIKDLNTALWSLNGEVRKIDKNMETLIKNKSDKYIESLESVKKKLFEAQERLHTSTLSKLQSIIDNIYPDGAMQERKINITYYLNKYGLDIISYIMNQIDIKAEGHQILLLNFSEKGETNQ